MCIRSEYQTLIQGVCMRRAPKNSVSAKVKMSNGRIFEGTIGNSKVPTTTLIFNMGSATTCPSDKLGLCSMGKINGDGSCYCLKAERLYPECKPFRNRQETMWLNSSANDIAKAINTIVKGRPYITAVRVNESGDFHTMKCVQKLSDIASKIQIPIYTYTHRNDLFTKNVTKNLNKNLTMNFSCDMGYEHNHNEFRLPEDVKPNTKTYECAGDCRICSLCTTRKNIVITNPKH